MYLIWETVIQTWKLKQKLKEIDTQMIAIKLQLRMHNEYLYQSKVCGHNCK